MVSLSEMSVSVPKCEYFIKCETMLPLVPNRDKTFKNLCLLKQGPNLNLKKNILGTCHQISDPFGTENFFFFFSL